MKIEKRLSFRKILLFLFTLFSLEIFYFYSNPLTVWWHEQIHILIADWFNAPIKGLVLNGSNSHVVVDVSLLSTPKVFLLYILQGLWDLSYPLFLGTLFGLLYLLLIKDPNPFYEENNI